MIYSADEMAMLNVQVFEMETLLDFMEFISDHFLKTHAFVVEESDEGIVVTLVGQSMVTVSTFSVNVKFLKHVLARSA